LSGAEVSYMCSDIYRIAGKTLDLTQNLYSVLLHFSK